MGEAEPAAITVYTLLASCAQRDERWGDAFNYYGRARDMAAAAGAIELAVAATNGLTGILVATGRTEAAVRLSAEIVEMARPSGIGLGVALFGAGNVLSAVGDDQAADRYVEALAQPDMDDLRGPVLMRLGAELHRQHRIDEAVARYYQAVDVYQATGHLYESYQALLRLSELSEAERTRAFLLAHNLVVEEFATVDTAHYEAFREGCGRSRSTCGGRSTTPGSARCGAWSTSDSGKGWRPGGDQRTDDQQPLPPPLRGVRGARAGGRVRARGATSR